MTHLTQKFRLKLESYLLRKDISKFLFKKNSAATVNTSNYKSLYLLLYQVFYVSWITTLNRLMS